MNRKEAERLSERWLEAHTDLFAETYKRDIGQLASLLLRTYKKGVKDGIVLGAVAVTPPSPKRGRSGEAN